VLREYGLFAARMGRTDSGIAAARRAVLLDPLNRTSHGNLGLALYYGRRYDESIAATAEALKLDPHRVQNFSHMGLDYYALGKFENARAVCELHTDDWQNQLCLAVTYQKLGRPAEAEAMLSRMVASMADAPAIQYVEIYAQWGKTVKALEWLDTAVRLRDPGLTDVKVDMLLDPLRKEPRFQAIERDLKFPPQ
jgi:tetratricopeptide (TPR) repeat protein